ncbi:hypothetical protein [Halobacillus karajensis]|uniref:hypothetical protein n=1 Tax=Halobacillus karajensis TaxID=195088 RepID=UPI00045CDD48|nr:hypothetical protein [Halobacillus karajensis]CDQ21735.1 hypothetical protein BN982_04144 [Halobacillus karajensis]
MKLVDQIIELGKELERKQELEKENVELKELATRKVSQHNQLSLEVNELKTQNYKLQMFIEDHCSEEDKKKIFNN